jgi:hypothetical protein
MKGLTQVRCKLYNEGNCNNAWLEVTVKFGASSVTAKKKNLEVSWQGAVLTA